MTRSLLSIAVLATFMGLAAADIPWPSSGKLAFPGAPALIDGAWLANAGSPSNPQFSIFRDGLNAGGRINEDGTFRSSVAKVLSFECLDENTVRYISQDNSSSDGGAVTTRLTCAVSRINATHRIVASYAEADGKCPDASELPDAETGYALSNTTGLIRTQVFTRQDGVLPGEPTLVCKNSTAPASAPPSGKGDSPLGTEIPNNLGTPLGPVTPTGVWANEGSMEIITPKGFMAVFVETAGGLRAINGQYLSHQCINSDSYIASNTQMQMYTNGTTVKGSHCEKGLISDDILQLMFSNGPDCTELITSNAFVATYKLIQSIPGFPTECGAITEQASSPGMNTPGGAGPASSAVRAVLRGAVVATFAALML